MTLPTDALSLVPGDRYGDFEIIELLGEGHFAKVYAARPLTGEFPPAVALKISRRPLYSETAAIRALREIRALQSLDNPHVVHILDHGMGEDERWFMVMELLEGRNLLAVHDFDRPMSPQRALELIYQACVGIDEAHRQGIVHRDLKPENLWIEARENEQGAPRLQVLDFGLARAWNTGATVGAQATVDHVLIGTPHYAQPEQVESGELTPASDIYSLGVILYELISGHTPYFPDEPWSRSVLRLRDKPLQWLRAHVKQAVTPIETHPGGRAIRSPVRALIHAMLDKDPTKRPATGAAVALELARALYDEYGELVAAKLRVHPSGQTHFLVPGPHTLGEDMGSVPLHGIGGEPRIVAELEWRGPPEPIRLSPVEVGTLELNAKPIARPLLLPDNAELTIGGLRAQLSYPRG